jgi:hypothetical protein
LQCRFGLVRRLVHETFRQPNLPLSNPRCHATVLPCFAPPTASENRPAG